MASHLAGRRIADRYVLQSPLEGARDRVVWKGWDEVLRRPVSVSVVESGSAEKDTLGVFRAQAMTTARLSHPFIVRIFDTGEEDGVAYLITEFVDAEPLDARLRDGTVDPHEAARMGRCVLQAILHAHENGVVHGELDGRSVLVGATSTVKVTGFGTAETATEARPEGDLRRWGELFLALLARAEPKEPGLVAIGERAARGDFGGAAEIIAALDRHAMGARSPRPSGVSGRQRRDGWSRLLPVALGLGVAGLVLGGILLSGGDDPASPGTQNGGARSHPLPIVAAIDHDPEGNGREHPETISLVLDGDASTAWTTEGYSTPQLGGLKMGVGLVLDLGGIEDVGSIRIVTDLPGWRFQLLGSTDGKSFSDPIAGESGETTFRADAQTEIAFEPGRIRYLLVWAVELAPEGGSFRASIAEVAVLSP